MGEVIVSTRRIALACLTPRPDGDELGALHLPSFGIRRVQAAVVGDPQGAGHLVRLFDLGGIAQKDGLSVILTEYHESRRVDRQFFGRCARQGEFRKLRSHRVARG
jgi:hypothetical protein